MSKHIFISYSRKDGGDYATAIETYLEDKKRGHKTWRDTRNLPYYKDFTAELENAIERASHLIVCLTRETKREDSYVRREIQYALAVDIPIIIMRCEDIPPHISIITLEFIDYFVDPDMALDRLNTILIHGGSDHPASKMVGTVGDEIDPFRSYLQRAYKTIVKFLNRTVIREISLRSISTPDAVIDVSEIDQFERLERLGQLHDIDFGQFENFNEAFSIYDNRLLILGERGSGKTTTLLIFARDAIAARLDDSEKPLPLFGSISTWKEDHGDLIEWLRISSHNLPTIELNRIVEAGNVLFLLDGLDELLNKRSISKDNGGHDPRQKFVELIPYQNQVILTCRERDYVELETKLKLKGAITLLPMMDEQIEHYLKGQPELWKLAQNDEQMREILRSPLILSTFAYAYEDLSESDRQTLMQLEHTFDVRYQIFNHYIRKQLKRENLRLDQNLALTDEQLIEDLQAIALWSVLGNFSIQGVFDMEALKEAKIIENPKIVIDIGVQLQILNQQDTGKYGFLHNLMHDTLAQQQALSLLHVDRSIDQQIEGINAIIQLADVSTNFLESVKHICVASSKVREHFLQVCVNHVDYWLSEGLLDEGKAFLELAEHLAKDINNHSNRANALNGLVRVASNQGNLPDAREYAEQLTSLLDHLDRIERIRIEALMGSWEGIQSARKGNLVEALVQMRSALDKALLIDDNATISIIAQNLANVLSMSGSLSEALEYLGIARDRSIHAGNYRTLANTLNTIGTIEAVTNLDRAGIFWSRAQHYANKAKDKRLEARVSGNLGELYSRYGEHDKARQTLNHGLTIAYKIQDVLTIGHILINLGSCEEKMGNYNLAMVHLQKVKVDAAQTPDRNSIPYSEVLALRVEARQLLHAGKRDDAKAKLELAIELATENGFSDLIESTKPLLDEKFT